MSFDLENSGLPAAIDVGPFPHTVKFKDLSAATERPVFAVYCYEDQEFSFQEMQPSQAFAVDTVLHELLHSLWRNGGLQHEKQAAENVEEKIVTVLATGLVQMMRDNPELLKWFWKHLQSREKPTRSKAKRRG